MRRYSIVSRERGGRTKHSAVYYLPDGSSRSAGTHTSKRAAKEAAIAAFNKAQKSGWVDPQKGKATLTSYAETVWFPSKSGIEKTTLRDYESVWKRHIKPAFGDRALSTILPTEIGTWLNKLEADGLGRSQQRKAFIILGMILKSARRDGVLVSNPAEGVQTMPLPRLPVRIFSPQQWEKFIEAVPEEYKMALQVDIATGLRLNELRALCPVQIKWGVGKILVDRGLVEVGKRLGDGERYAAKAYPKGRRERYVEVDKPTLRMLAQEIMRRGLAKDSTEPIFVVNGKPLDQSAMSDVFKAARDEAGIDKKLTMKHLRSSRASWLLKETGDVAKVQRELGHADLTTTQKYVAVVEEIEADDDAAFEDYLKEEEG